jgi:hypothetical protein
MRNGAAEKEALVLCIRQVPGWNLGPYISYPDRGIPRRSTAPLGKCQNGIYVFKIMQNIISS